MKGEIDGKQYRIWFRHGNNDLRRTDCIVEWQAPDGQWLHAMSAYSTLHPSDNYEKEVGRKVSLARALSPFERDFRTKIWAIYHGRKAAK